MRASGSGRSQEGDDDGGGGGGVVYSTEMAASTCVMGMQGCMDAWTHG